MTLETQYKNYLKRNPDSNLTQEQWVSQILGPMLHKALSQMGNEEPGTIWLDTETENINKGDDEN
jgi:hypothetical protein